MSKLAYIKINKKLKSIFTSLFILILFLVFVAFGLKYLKNNSKVNNSNTTTKDENLKTLESDILTNDKEIDEFLKLDKNTLILVVNNEKIYKKVFDYYYQPFKQLIIKGHADKKQVVNTILNNIIEESLVLQDAGKQNKIVLNDEIYNNPNLDPEKRSKLFQSIKKELIEKSKNLKVGIITIFYKNIDLVDYDYETAKKIAKQKIDEIYEQVKSGKLTIEQAGEKLKNDTSLAKLDKSYKANVYTEFEIKDDQPMTFSHEFNELLRNTKQGELTPIMDVYDPSVKDKKEYVAYMFGYVFKHDKNSFNYDNYLKNLRSNAKIQYNIKLKTTNSR